MNEFGMVQPAARIIELWKQWRYIKHVCPLPFFFSFRLCILYLKRYHGPLADLSRALHIYSPRHRENVQPPRDNTVRYALRDTLSLSLKQVARLPVAPGKGEIRLVPFKHQWIWHFYNQTDFFRGFSWLLMMFFSFVGCGENCLIGWNNFYGAVNNDFKTY